VCVSSCTCACARMCVTTHAHNMNFIKSQCFEFRALWDVMMCHWMNSEQFLTIQGILLPLQDQQPLVQQHSITSQSVWISSSTAERTSALTLHFILWNTTHTCIQHRHETEQLAPVSSCRQQSPHLVSPCLVVLPAAGQTQSHTQHTSLFHLAWQCCRHQESVTEVLYASTLSIFGVW